LHLLTTLRLVSVLKKRSMKDYVKFENIKLYQENIETILTIYIYIYIYACMHAYDSLDVTCKMNN
jgi:uncharacterized protein involved in tellurium resistance